MASERDAAKSEAAEPESSDPELGKAIVDAQDLANSLHHARENNRHKETLARIELGWLGGFLGGEKTAPTVIALIAALIGFGISFTCLVLAAKQADRAAFWSEWSSRALTVSTTALGFVFGRGLK